MVELHLAKVGVEGSNPFARSNSFPADSHSPPCLQQIIFETLPVDRCCSVGILLFDRSSDQSQLHIAWATEPHRTTWRNRTPAIQPTRVSQDNRWLGIAPRCIAHRKLQPRPGLWRGPCRHCGQVKFPGWRSHRLCPRRRPSQGEEKCRSMARLALDPDFSSVRADNVAHDRQPKPCSPLVA